MTEKIPLITDDSIVFGLLMLALALIFLLVIYFGWLVVKASISRCFFLFVKVLLNLIEI